MATACDAAKYFLHKADEDGDSDVSHLKLQKLLYYAQSAHLARVGTPLFSDNLNKWTHGPVCEKVYNAYSNHAGNPIPPPIDFDPSRYSASEVDTLDRVYEYFGQFSAWKLRQMTHDESPWLEAPPSGILSKPVMADYFREHWMEAVMTASERKQALSSALARRVAPSAKALESAAKFRNSSVKMK